MTELVKKNQLNTPTVAELPVERVEFEAQEIVHTDAVLPKIDISGAERFGVLSEEHSNHIQAVGGQNIEAEALKVLPEHIVNEVVIKGGDVEWSSSWLAVLKGRVAKLKGVV